MSPLGRLCPGCGDLVIGSCPRPSCKPQPNARTVEVQRVYKDRRWMPARAKAWRRDDYTCVDCGYHDDTRTGAGLLGDHVLPVAGVDDPLAFNPENIDTRCFPCSGRKDGGRRPSSVF